jgi:tripartite-type tricarboxylate transporter receptor subunit TctC
MKRKVLSILVLGFLTMGVWQAAGQEKYPSRPVDFICTWGVGGGADQMARMLGGLLEKILGVPFPVSNKPGASGNTGIVDLMAAKADGYTIAVYIASTLNTVAAGTSRHKIEDLEWITRTQKCSSFLFVRSDSPFKTIHDLLNYAKENPGKLKVGTEGFNSVDDITIRYLGSKGYKMTVVPQPSPGERYAATLGGHQEVLYEQAGDIKQFLDAGQLRPLIVFSDKRHPAFPDVPCSVELGFDVKLPQFRSVVAKKGVPPDRIRILADAIKKAMDTPEWKKFEQEQYVDPDSYMGPDEFPKWVKSEYETMRKLMVELGMLK